MDITMLRNKMVSEDGVTTRHLEAGETYTLDDKLADSLVAQGLAKLPPKPSKRENQK